MKVDYKVEEYRCELCGNLNAINVSHTYNGEEVACDRCGDILSDGLIASRLLTSKHNPIQPPQLPLLPNDRNKHKGGCE